MVEDRLIEILRCPLGKSKLRQEKDFLVCQRCGVKFPVRAGIPVMLIHEAVLPQGIDSIDQLPCRKEQNKA